MKITLTENHLNAALAVPWSVKTCLLAQAAKEALGREVECAEGEISTCDGGVLNHYFCPTAIPLQRLFDSGHYFGVENTIEKLRGMLPVEAELS